MSSFYPLTKRSHQLALESCRNGFNTYDSTPFRTLAASLFWSSVVRNVANYLRGPSELIFRPYGRSETTVFSFDHMCTFASIISGHPVIYYTLSTDHLDRDCQGRLNSSLRLDARHSSDVHDNHNILVTYCN